MKVKQTRNYLFNQQVVTSKMAQKAIKKAVTQKTNSTALIPLKYKFTCHKCTRKFLHRSTLLKHKCQSADVNARRKLQQMEEHNVNQPAKERQLLEQEDTNNGLFETYPECPICHDKFKDELSLKCHRVTHIGYKPYTCHVCTNTFNSEIEWQNHIQSSFGHSHCNECFQNFGCVVAKNRHLCTDTTDYSCLHCHTTFKSRSAMDRHLETCKLKKTCRRCGKVMKEQYLRRHMRVCEGQGNVDNTSDKPDDESFKSDEKPENESDPVFKGFVDVVSRGKEPQTNDSNVKIASETIRLNGPVSSLVMCSIIRASNMNNKEDDLLSRCEICCREFQSLRAKNIHRRVHFQEKNRSARTEVDRGSYEPNRGEAKLWANCEKCQTTTNFKKVTEEDMHLIHCDICGSNECNCDPDTKKKTYYICTKCKGFTKTDVELDLFCGKCQEIFLDETLYNDHMDGHNIAENTSFSKEMELKSPEKNGTANQLSGNYDCEVCGRAFKSKRSLHFHKTRRNACKKNNNKQNEMKRSTTPKPHYQKDYSKSLCCLKCEKVFPSSVQFQHHLKTCLTGADGDVDMNAHCNNELKRLHTTLNDSVTLTTLGTGSGFACYKCMKLFRSQKHLELHEKQMHKEFQCRLCSSVFSKNEELTAHNQTHNKHKFDCDICKLPMPSDVAVRFHRLTHFSDVPSKPYSSMAAATTVYTCLHCKLKFISFRKFERHCKSLAINSTGDVIEIESNLENSGNSTATEKDSFNMEETEGTKSVIGMKRKRLSSGNNPLPPVTPKKTPRKIAKISQGLKKDVSEHTVSTPNRHSTPNVSPLRVFHQTLSNPSRKTQVRTNLNNLQDGSTEVDARRPSMDEAVVPHKTNNKANFIVRTSETGDRSVNRNLLLLKQGKLLVEKITDEEYGAMYGTLEQKLTTLNTYGDDIPLSVMHHSSAMKTVYYMMELCIRSHGKHNASVRVKKLVKGVFSRIVSGRVTAGNPHSCMMCNKQFTYPQGITNHYFRKHGADGVIKSLKDLYCRQQQQHLQQFPTSSSSLSPVAVNGAKDKPFRTDDELDEEEDDDNDYEDDEIQNGNSEQNGIGGAWSEKDDAVLTELRDNVSKLLCHLVNDKDVLEELGWPNRLIDDVLVDVITRCANKPTEDLQKSLLDRLRDNITILLTICVKEQAMESFGWYTKPVEEVVKEMLTGGIDPE